MFIQHEKKVLESSNLKDEILEKLGIHAGKISQSGVEKVDYDEIVAGFLEVVPFDSESTRQFKKELEKKI